MQHRWSPVTWAALWVSLTVAACGGGGVAPGFDDGFSTPAPEVTPSATPGPAPMQAAAIEAWAGAPVTSVCLATSQTYPQVKDFRYPIGDWVKALLEPVGVTVAGKNGPCDADLKVATKIEGRSAKYGENAKRYYTGVNRLITVTLSAPDRKPVKSTSKLNLPPGEVASSLDPTTPKALLEDQTGVVVEAIVGGLVKAWGPAVAVEAMCLPVQQEPYLSIAFKAEQVLLDVSGLRQVALDDAGPVPNDYPSWRLWAETGEAIEGAGGEPGAGCP